MNQHLTQWLSRRPPILLSLFAIAGAFTTYFSMYAFRKPFTAATFGEMEAFGLDYKVVAVIAQVFGYTLSKFAGIRVISELTRERRGLGIIVLISFAWLALLGFALAPRPWNIAFLFLNGLPLGMIWGVVFSYLEGRRFTEMMGAGLCASFIVSSGAVKSVGRHLVVDGHVSEFWMPFATGAIFLVPLLAGAWLLSLLPPPTEADEADRTERVPMDKAARKAFFGEFAVGIVLVVTIYALLNVFRDIRDNFSVEIWSALGFADTPSILATAEVPIAVGVLIFIGLMSFVRPHRTAFYLNFHIIVGCGLCLGLSTFAFERGFLAPIPWMILNGFCMYLAYIAYHTFLFERWIALFRRKSNIGYLQYISDAFGYVGSVAVMLSKSLLQLQLSWFSFFVHLAYVTSVATLVLGLAGWLYFRLKERRRGEAGLKEITV
jgi:hypothetical protein